jgi:5,10-methylenetetrahydromethanopterin reductase
LQVAGELADGVILNVGLAPELISEAMGHVRRGAQSVGREAGDVDVAVIAGACINADRRRAIEEARSWAATTARRVGKWMLAGGDEIRRVGATVLGTYRWDDHIAAGAAHARPVSDEMAGKFVLAGTADDVARRIEVLARCGVGHVIPLLMGPNMENTIDAFGREIIPAWRQASVATKSSA